MVTGIVRCGDFSNTCSRSWWKKESHEAKLLIYLFDLLSHWMLMKSGYWLETEEANSWQCWTNRIRLSLKCFCRYSSQNLQGEGDPRADPGVTEGTISPSGPRSKLPFEPDPGAHWNNACVGNPHGHIWRLSQTKRRKKTSEQKKIKQIRCIFNRTLMTTYDGKINGCN